MLRRRPERGRRLRRAAVCALAALVAAGCRPGQEDAAPPRGDARPELGLLTSLPIYWGEPAELSDVLDGTAERHWVRARLEQDYTLVPMDTLEAADGRSGTNLGTLDRLLVAQPRALTPADNVALDQWVRDGGRLLLVLDPMMTEHSDYPVGDKRRFNDVALIPPVLARWGLSMRYSDGAPPQEVTYRGGTIRVEEYGTLSPAAADGTRVDANCVLDARGVIARCRIGKGTALVVADAAFLNREGAGRQAEDAADAIFTAAFG